MSDVTLMLGDCLDRMGEIPAGSIDLILADLPYGTTACAWDSVIPLEPLWAHYRRILKPRGAVVLTASQPFTSALVMSNPKWFRYEWIWEKSTGTGFLDAKRKPLKCHESACVFYAKQPTYRPQKIRGERNHSTGLQVGSDRERSVYRGGYTLHKSDRSGMKYPRSVIRFAKHSSTETLHKTQKPVALCEYLVRTYSDEGDMILDNAMGSGTTGEACINAGRNFIGIEKDADIFATAERRIAAAQDALPLFAPASVPPERREQSSMFA